MIEVLIGELFESRAQTLVNTVNCVGVMGKGIALEFKKRFPDMYVDYVKRCRAGQVELGRPYLYRPAVPPWILNFPTKDHWRSVARINDIVYGLKYLLNHYKEWGITSIAVPPLGCGHGQLEWRVVAPTLYRYLKQMDILVELYAPYGTPHEELQAQFLTGTPKIGISEEKMPVAGWIKPAWVALVEILKRIEQEPYHWPVGRTTFQKIAFVATYKELPTGLKYQKSDFGPFSPELKGLITRLVNNGLIREERLGRMYSVKVGPTYNDAEKAYHRELRQWEPIIEKISDLFMRLNTRRAEVVSSILFAADSLTKEKKERPAEAEVLKEIMEWKQRRSPPLNESEVAYTIRNLAALSWLNVKPSKDLPIPEEALIDD